jgi:mandelamide amidase
LHELGLVAAARAIRHGEMSAEAYAGGLLRRARELEGLAAFITIDDAAVMEAARQADRSRHAGVCAPLLGVPLAVKDSYLTEELTTTLGTSLLAAFKPAHDAVAVARMKRAGAIVFGKNNLVEMSYGLTGLNEHHGQVKNPYHGSHISGGSSSGGAASVAARIVPAALGGDTIGSIRVPASLCGVVGFKPTPGRWPGEGVAPIAPTLDTPGLLARSVEDCAVVNAILTGTLDEGPPGSAGLRHLKLAYAPRQHLADVDAQAQTTFCEALRTLQDAGATLVEIDLGEDFFALSARATWPIFFHETWLAVRAFLADAEVPVSIEQIHAGLGEHVRDSWSRAVLPSSAGYVSEETYRTALTVHRPELRRRLSSIAFGRADALVLPTTPCAAPRVDSQWAFQVAGKAVTDTFLARNTHPSSAAGLPGISIPMRVDAHGFPLGLEIDAAPGSDRALLAAARSVERVIGCLPGPPDVFTRGTA